MSAYSSVTITRQTAISKLVALISYMTDDELGECITNELGKPRGYLLTIGQKDEIPEFSLDPYRTNIDYD